jgi:hypothetical protein
VGAKAAHAKSKKCKNIRRSSDRNWSLRKCLKVGHQGTVSNA